MKSIKTLFFVFVLVLMNVTSALAQDPDEPGDGTPKDGLPINQHMVFLVGAGIILGITVLYKNKTKKASM